MSEWSDIYTVPKDGRRVVIAKALDNDPTKFVWMQTAISKPQGFARPAGIRGRPTHWRPA